MIYGDGEQRRDFVHVGDIVAANLLAMTAAPGSGIYNVGTGVATSVNEVARLLCSIINPAIEPYHVDAHAGELRNSIAAIGSIGADLGYRPRGRLRDRIEEVVDYYRT